MQPGIEEKSASELEETFRTLKTRRDVAKLLGVTTARLTHVLYAKGVEAYYKTWEIKKKSGGWRTIRAPQSSVYFFQAAVNRVLQAVYVPKASTHGFVRGRNIVTNAAPHVARRHVLNFDLKDFFPSINFGRVRGVFLAKPFECTAEVATIFAKICCVDNALPIGGPTSPIVANMICLRLDKEMQQLARKNGCWYTRYGDDMTFSTNRKLFPDQLLVRDGEGTRCGEDLVRVISSNGFEVQPEKTRLLSQGARQDVTGIVVNDRLNVDRRFVRRIRAMLHAWAKHGLVAAQAHLPHWYTKDRHGSAEPKFEDVLQGRIAFLGMVRGKDDPLYKRYRRQFANLSKNRPMNDGVTHPAPGAMRHVDNTPVRVLHLSDFHFQSNTSWDADPLLAQLAEIIGQLEPPDLVVVTGDVAQSGKKAEYDLAEQWFRNRLAPAARIELDNLFFVPGNHDVDRALVGVMVRSAQESILHQKSHDTIEATFSSQLERELFLSRFAEYEAFVRRLRPDGPELHRPWWCHSVLRNDVTVRIIGICTAWMSWQKEEQGKLLIGLPQINQLVRDSGDINLALMHHPLSYLAEMDAPAVQELENWAHVVLRGHLHAEKATELSDHQNHHVVAAAGSAYQGSTHPNGFQLVELYAGDRVCKVHPYRWNASRRRWHKSRDVFATDDGVGVFGFGASYAKP